MILPATPQPGSENRASMPSAPPASTSPETGTREMRFADAVRYSGQLGGFFGACLGAIIAAELLHHGNINISWTQQFGTFATLSGTYATLGAALSAALAALLFSASRILPVPKLLQGSFQGCLLGGTTFLLFLKIAIESPRGEALDLDLPTTLGWTGFLFFSALVSLCLGRLAVSYYQLPEARRRRRSVRWHLSLIFIAAAGPIATIAISPEKPETSVNRHPLRDTRAKSTWDVSVPGTGVSISSDQIGEDQNFYKLPSSTLTDPQNIHGLPMELKCKVPLTFVGVEGLGAEILDQDSTQNLALDSILSESVVYRIRLPQLGVATSKWADALTGYSPAQHGIARQPPLFVRPWKTTIPGSLWLPSFCGTALLLDFLKATELIVPQPEHLNHSEKPLLWETLEQSGLTTEIDGFDTPRRSHPQQSRPNHVSFRFIGQHPTDRWSDIELLEQTDSLVRSWKESSPAHAKIAIVLLPKSEQEPNQRSLPLMRSKQNLGLLVLSDKFPSPPPSSRGTKMVSLHQIRGLVLEYWFDYQDRRISAPLQAICPRVSTPRTQPRFMLPTSVVLPIGATSGW